MIDLSRLVPAEYINDNDNVLNGIAYNEMTGHVYITGKRWPVLYEIEILE
ncbi:MAG: glutaminyl-peptide cyclotransferase [Bacteroidia bacterium]|nr:glutaminyl-peptide cyclotransferase [Bacteroidia bacterium]